MDVEIWQSFSVFLHTSTRSGQASDLRSLSLRMVKMSLQDIVGTLVDKGMDQRSPGPFPECSSYLVSVSFACRVFPHLLSNSDPIVFPGFWFCGALMLITPFRSSDPLNLAYGWPPNAPFAVWCNEHLETDEEKAQYIKKFQAAERRWAKRCLLALFVMVAFGVAFGAMIYGILRSTSLKSSDSAEPSSAIWTS